jgi:CubicO group peptidase (beta-lactamase class C family)
MAGLQKLFILSGLMCLGLPIGARAQTAVSKDAQQKMEKVTACLPGPVVVKGDAAAVCASLAERMAALHVNGVSIAVIHNGAIEWAQGFGVQQAGGKPVTAETMFQAGSISKPVAAMAALRLVQTGKLGLDTDVNTELTSWKVPASDAAPGATVTLRDLLTHTAGFTVHGFPGYAQDAPVPTLVQVLNGEKPANTPAIRLESVPGTKWNYSGGGFTVMLQTVLDVTKEPFPKLMHDTVLGPIGMTHSTYEQPLPKALEGMAATPYLVSGAPVAGGAHTYPEMTAAGLWTTPSDLARYILENQQSLSGKANHVLAREMTEQMMTPGKGNWGLGVEIGGSAGNPYFTHGGVNEGFESMFVGYEKNGEGAVVMTNAQGGGRLVDEMMRSIAKVYSWPDFGPVVRTAVKVDPSVLARYAGTYNLAPNFDITFTVENGELMTQATRQAKLAMFAESETKFSLKVVDAEVEFLPDATGKVSSMVLHQNGQDHKGTRVP